MIYLTNPGTLDPRVITTMGVSVKESDNPIGYFGTGLKYAIAVLLRNKCSIVIESGSSRYFFSTKEETIRGKDFSLVYMNDKPLGFTTELGRNWQVWMALRELYSNARDEHGSWGQNPPKIDGTNTTIAICGEAAEEAYADRNAWLLPSAPLYTFGNVELHPYQGKNIFYQGIKVAASDRLPRFTYNILSGVTLTEDRTATISSVTRLITQAICQDCTDQTVLNTFLLLPKDTFEGFNFFHSFYNSPSESFIECAKRLAETHRGTVNRAALNICSSYIEKKPIVGLTPSAFNQKILNRALAFLKRLGYDVLGSNPVVIVESLGSHWIQGAAEEGTIYLPEAVFDKGVAYVASTILEEHLHATKHLSDESRDMQDYLLQKVIALGQQVIGEPL